MAVASGQDRRSDVGRMVRARRQEAGLTQCALASLVGVSVATVRGLEQGRTRRPRTALLDRLAAALGLESAQLRERGFDPPPATQVLPGSGLRLRILGPVTAWRDGHALALGEPRRRGLLGLLALHAGANVHRGSLIDALWGRRPPAAAVNLVQAYVGRLRRVLDPDHSPRDAAGVLVCTGTGYRLQVPGDHLDLLSFRSLVSRAAAAQDRDGAASCKAYEQALRLWRGDPLADVDVLRGHPAVAAVTREWTDAVAGYAGATLQAGTPERVLPYLWQWVGGDPLDEKAHALLMLALAAAGQQAAALDVFADVRGRLNAEMGVRPGPELSGAHVRILRQQVANVARTTEADPPSVVPRQLPASARHFVGRVEELRALDQMLACAPASPGPVIGAITGTAGIGKTTLALRWAHQVTDQFPDGQLFVNLRGYDPVGPPLDPFAAIRGFLEVLSAPADGMPREPHAQAARYRSLLAGRRLLVVLDNAHDSQQVRPLLPGTAGSMVLITSRSDLTGLVAGESAQKISLPLLGDTESRHLLVGHLGAERVAGHPDAADELVALCARLPLALSIIGVRAAGHPDFPLDVLAGQLRDARGRLDALCVGEATSDLRAVLACSYQHLSPPGARLFRLLGLHPGPDISAAAATSLAGVPASAAGPLLSELIRGHLIDEHVPGRYAIHDLLRAYAAERSQMHDSEDGRRAAVHRTLDHYLHTARAAVLLQEPPRERLVLPEPVPGVVPESPVDDAHASAWFASEHPVLMRCVALAADAGQVTHAWRLAWTLVTSFSRRGHWDDLTTALRTALGAASRADDLTGQAYAHRFLGRVRALSGFHDEAYGHLRQALDLFGRLGDTAGQAAAHVGLAREFEWRDEPAVALQHAKQALELQHAAGDRIGEVNGLNTVAWCYVRLGDHTQALASSQQALALALQPAIGHRPGEAHAWDTLGYTYHHLDRPAEAASCYARALELYRRLDDKYEQARTMGRLGDTHAAAGDVQAARSCWHQAVTLLDELHHPDADKLRGKLRRA